MEPSHAEDLRLIGIHHLPDIRPGTHLGKLLAAALRHQELEPQDGDVLVVTQKVVSKAENRVVDLRTVSPSPFARAVARQFDKDPRLVEVVLAESKRIVRMHGGVLISETHHGFICANAGVDQSNIAPDHAVLLPVDPDRSARDLRGDLETEFSRAPALVISDTFGRPWRMGQTNVAIGVAGMEPLWDYRGQQDTHDNELRVTEIAVADELAAAAELVMQKTRRIPAVLVRGLAVAHAEGHARQLIRPPEQDLFR